MQLTGQDWMGPTAGDKKKEKKATRRYKEATKEGEFSEKRKEQKTSDGKIRLSGRGHTVASSITWRFEDHRKRMKRRINWMRVDLKYLRSCSFLAASSFAGNLEVAQRTDKNHAS